MQNQEATFGQTLLALPACSVFEPAAVLRRGISIVLTQTIMLLLLAPNMSADK